MGKNTSMDTEVMIEVKGLWKGFGGYWVLQGVDFSIREGEIFVVMGRSGVGKSVLLKNLIGLMKPDRGEIYYKGLEISSASPAEWKNIRKEFAVVFQHSALFDSLDVEGNVAFGLRRMTDLSEDEIKARVRECLAMVDLEGIEHLKISELSGGMQKRVAIARAIALNPRVIFYDEPTTGLDPIMSAVITRLVKRMNTEIHSTSFIITHDLKLAFNSATTIAMLHDGKIIEVGTPEKIKASENPIVKKFVEGIPD